MQTIPSSSVDLIVTSPPYPMIAMWDEQFSSIDPVIADALEADEGNTAFSRMHMILDEVWNECARILKANSFACINIGDATRNIGNRFRLFSNHASIIDAFSRLGFDVLPCILWRKQTNAPNKFMGSGMLPAGAYVTLEHEYILIFRKGGKRTFTKEDEKQNRRKSGYFWEERNTWFSDVWDFKGVSQPIKNSTGRARSGSFPLELAYRLINMYSVKEDMVCDPFAGLGTSCIAAAISERNSVGLELESDLQDSLKDSVGSLVSRGNTIISDRLKRHEAFILEYIEKGKAPKYVNRPHGMAVVTSQEQDLQIKNLASIDMNGPHMIVTYDDPIPGEWDPPKPTRQTGQGELF